MLSIFSYFQPHPHHFPSLPPPLFESSSCLRELKLLCTRLLVGLIPFSFTFELTVVQALIMVYLIIVAVLASFPGAQDSHPSIPPLQKIDSFWAVDWPLIPAVGLVSLLNGFVTTRIYLDADENANRLEWETYLMFGKRRFLAKARLRGGGTASTAICVCVQPTWISVWVVPLSSGGCTPPWLCKKSKLILKKSSAVHIPAEIFFFERKFYAPTVTPSRWALASRCLPAVDYLYSFQKRTRTDRTQLHSS